MSDNNDELQKYFTEHGDDSGSIRVHRRSHGKDVEYEVERAEGANAKGIYLSVWSGGKCSSVTLPHVDSVGTVEALMAILRGDE